MRGEVVEVVIELFNVFSMISFLIAQSEKPFFQDLVLAVPEGYCETEVLKEVGDAAQAVFAPEISPAVGMVIREIVPGVAIRTVVLSYCPPLSFAQVRSPLF